MNLNDKENCDAILRKLYKSAAMQYYFWSDLYTELGMLPDEANYYLRYLTSRGLVHSPTKGRGGVDGQAIQITTEGRVFFADDNLVSEFNRKQNIIPITSTTNTFNYHAPVTNIKGKHIHDVHVSDVINAETKKENWLIQYFKPILLTVFGGLILAYLKGWLHI